MLKRKAPSREKYEKENPTLSARVPKEFHDKLQKKLADLGISLADGLKIFAGEIEIIEVLINKATKIGYQQALKKYVVPYSCSVCGENVLLSNPETKIIVAKLLVGRGLGHQKCLQQNKSKLSGK